MCLDLVDKSYTNKIKRSAKKDKDGNYVFYKIIYWQNKPHGPKVSLFQSHLWEKGKNVSDRCDQQGDVGLGEEEVIEKQVNYGFHAYVNIAEYFKEHKDGFRCRLWGYETLIRVIVKPKHIVSWGVFGTETSVVFTECDWDGKVIDEYEVGTPT